MAPRGIRLAALAIVAAPLLCATGAQASYWTQMFVFGDSLSDSGNAAALTQSPQPPLPGLISYFPPSGPFPGFPNGVPYDFRFSNGPVAAEYLAQQLGLPPSLPAWPVGNVSNPNYAVGGGMTGTRMIGPTLEAGNYNWLVDSPTGLQALYPAVRDTGLDAQVALFRSRALAFDSTTTLFSVWSGANDIFLGLDLAAAGIPVDFDALVLSSVANIANRIGELAFLGGGMHFLVINMPDLGLTPFAIDEGLETQLTAISQGFNTALAFALVPLKQAGLDIIEFDAFAEFQALIANAAALGFTNTTEPCFDRSAFDPLDPLPSLQQVLSGCPGYVYFDGVHPTTATHAVIAASLARAVPEPGVLALLATALLVGGAFVRRRRQQG